MVAHSQFRCFGRGEIPLFLCTKSTTEMTGNDYYFFFSSDCRFALRIIYGFISLRNRGKCDTVETAGATVLLNGNTMIRFSLGEPGYDF